MWEIFWSLLKQFNFLTGLLKRYYCENPGPSLIINFTYWEVQTKLRSQKIRSLLSVCQLSVVFLCHFRFIHFFFTVRKWTCGEREVLIGWVSLSRHESQQACWNASLKSISFLQNASVMLVLFCFFSWNFNCIHSLLGSNYTTLFHVFAPVNQNQATTSKLHLLQRSVSAIRSGAAIVGNYSLLLLFLLLMKLFFFFKKLLDYLALLKGAGSSRKGTLIFWNNISNKMKDEWMRILLLAAVGPSLLIG